MHPKKDGIGIVTQCFELSSLDKLKFRKDNSGVLVVYFKNGGVIKYVLKKAKECVAAITDAILVDNDNRALPRSLPLQDATSIANAVTDIERKFCVSPCLGLVCELMELQRIAVERYSEAADDRFTATLMQLKSFLMRTDVGELLDADALQKRINESKVNSESHRETEGLRNNSDNSTPSTTLSSSSSISATDQLLLEMDTFLSDVDLELLEALRESQPHNSNRDDFDDIDLDEEFGWKMGSSLASTVGVNSSTDELDVMLDDMDGEFARIMASFS